MATKVVRCYVRLEPNPKLPRCCKTDKGAARLAAWAIGLSTGPIIGGAIAEKTTWRWIFYLMFPICGFGLVTIPYLLTLRPKTATMQEKFRRIDWLGGFLFTGSTTTFLIAISWGGLQVRKYS